MAIPLLRLSIALNQRRWSCVLDPSLFLSQYGLALVQMLGDVLELWITRELWHILDNPSFYLTQPNLVAPQAPVSQAKLKSASDLLSVVQQQRIQVFRGWERFRAETPASHLNLFWVGDRPSESFLPDGTNAHLMEHWEMLARALEERSVHPVVSHDVLASALRDTAALAAVLGSAFILTCQQFEEANEPPEICQILEQWEVPCRQIDPHDAIAELERENLHQLIISTGFSKFLWAGLHLVVLHLVVPSAFTFQSNTRQLWATHSVSQESDLESLPSITNMWEGAQGFWYCL
jgi:hypothetical protein